MIWLIRAVLGWVRRPIRSLVRGVFWFCVFSALITSAYRWINPPITITIIGQWIDQGTLERDWRSLDEISPHLPRAVIAAEDARFCNHYGFDFIEIRKALADADRRRGASTITQQVAKNVFLWPDASWFRKGLEAGFTVLIEAFWPKARTMEVYLNVAEFGPGVFGAEAAARHAFGKSAIDLTRAEASRLAAILPNPRERSASQPSNFVAKRARSIAGGAETVAANGGADCVLIAE